MIMTDRWEGDLLVDRDVEVRGMIAGNVLVRTGGRLLLTGMVCGDLHAEAGSTVLICGSVNGLVSNHGANLEIRGVVDDVVDAAGASTRLAPDAVVRARDRHRLRSI